MIPSSGDFPGGPVTESLPSSSGDAGSIPGQGAEIPLACCQKKKKKKPKPFNNIITNSMKTVKMVHIKKILKKKMILSFRTLLSRGMFIHHDIL